MEPTQLKPKSFGEILDTSFSISKKHFPSLFLMLLFLIGPIFIVDYLFMIVSGIDLFRETSGGGFGEQLMNNLDSAGNIQASVAANLGIGMEMVYLGLNTILNLVLYTMAQAAVIIAAGKVIKGESWTKKTAVKGAFSRFWPLIGSSLLLGVIVFGVFFVFFIVIGFGGIGLTLAAGDGAGFIPIILLVLGFIALLAFFGTRLSMFFGSVVYKKAAPGFTESWKLTKGRFWATLGLFVVFGIIIFLLTSIFDAVSIILLGGSVAGKLLTDLSTLLGTLFLMVGYTVLLYDLKTRNEGGDLKDMIASYKNM